MLNIILTSKLISILSFLKLDNRAHIGNEELEKFGFLKVNDRVKQLKLGHVFKIKKKSCSYYLATNFQNLNDN